MLVLARVRSKKKSPQRARLQSSTFGGFLDLVKISAIRSEVGPKSGPKYGVGPKSELGPKLVRSLKSVRNRTVFSKFWPQSSLLAVLMHFGQGSIPLYERSTSLIQAQPGANRLVKGATSDYRMFCFGPVPTRNKAKFCPSLS